MHCRADDGGSSSDGAGVQQLVLSLLLALHGHGQLKGHGMSSPLAATGAGMPAGALVAWPATPPLGMHQAASRASAPNTPQQLGQTPMLQLHLLQPPSTAASSGAHFGGAWPHLQPPDGSASAAAQAVAAQRR